MSRNLYLRGVILDETDEAAIKLGDAELINRLPQQLIATGDETENIPELPKSIATGEEYRVYFKSSEDTTDDAARLQALLDAVPAGTTVELLPSAVPYVWTSTLVPSSHKKLVIGHGVIVEFVRPFGLGTAPIAWNDSGEGGTSTLVGVLSSAVDAGVKVWPMSAVTGLAAGDYIYANGNGGRFMTQVVSIDSLNVTVKEGYWADLPECSVYKAAVLENFELENNGIFRGYMTGDFDDSRIVYAQNAIGCKYTGSGTYQITQGQNPQSFLGFDIGGMDNIVEGPRLVGFGTPDTLSTGVGVEGQRRTVINKITAKNLGFPVWLNSTHACKVDNICADYCFGIAVLTAILITADGIGCHGNQFGKTSLTNMVSGGYGLWFGHDATDNTFESIVIRGTDAISAGTAVYFGANGALGSKRNRIGCLNVSGINVVVNHGVASTDNVIEEMIVSSTANLVMIYTGSSLSVGNITGSVLNGNTFAVGGANLDIGRMRLAIARTTGTIFCNAYSASRVRVRDAVITHSGSGYAYGFISNTGTPGTIIDITDSDLGTWATNSFAMGAGDEVRLHGKVNYAGTVLSTPINRIDVTANGATAVRFPLLSAVASDEMCFRRITTGGTPAATPLITAVAPLALVAHNLDALSGIFNVTHATTNAIREDTATSSHYFVDDIASWTNTRPILARVRLQAVGRNFVNINGGGAAGVVFNLLLGTVVSASGTAVGRIVKDAGGAGIHDCYVYIPLWETSDIIVYLSTDGTTLSYVGGGSTVGVNVLAIETTRLGYGQLTAIAGDTSNYRVTQN